MPLQIVVPMAGEGLRFREAGYRTPKPLVLVSGVPMCVRAVQDLPPANRLVFVVRGEHVRNFGLDGVLRTYFPHCRIVPVEGRTEGQACTVRLAGPELEADWPVVVAACDCTHLYDSAKLAALVDDPDVACAAWTYRGEPHVLVHPRQHGWARADGERLLEVSCKQPVSDRLLEDHVLSGFFTARSARLMLEGIDQLVASGPRVNKEFYLDSVPNLLISRGLLARVFEVEKYIGWGTPADLDKYQKWERYFIEHR